MPRIPVINSISCPVTTDPVREAVEKAMQKMSEHWTEPSLSTEDTPEDAN